MVFTVVMDFKDQYLLLECHVTSPFILNLKVCLSFNLRYLQHYITMGKIISYHLTWRKQNNSITYAYEVKSDILHECYSTECYSWVFFSQAALAGGTTMVIGHVLPEKNESLLEAYESCRSMADPKTCCDYALHVGVTWWGPKVRWRCASQHPTGLV